MGPAHFIARSQRRGHRGAGVVLVTLVAVTGASILALATAYRRADTVIDRWTATAIPYDRSILAQLPPEQMTAMPGVVRADRQAFVAAGVVGSDAGNETAVGLDGMAMEMSAVDSTFLLLDGAIPDGSDPLSVLANEEAAKLYRLRPGDSFRVRFFAPDQLDSVMSGDYTPGGPEKTVRIAGVVRAPSDITSDRWVPSSSGLRNKPALIYPISLYDRFGTELLRVGRAWMYNVRLAPDADLAAFEQHVAATVGEGVDDFYPAFASFPPSFPRRLAELAAPVDTQADILAALLAIVTAASTFAVAVAVRTAQRQLAGDRATLAALGATRSTEIGAACWRVWPAVASGLAVAVPMAWVVSDRLPIGLATKVEPSPGRTLNVTLTAWVVGVWGLVVAACIVAAVYERRVSPTVAPRLRRIASMPRRLDLALTVARASRGSGGGRAAIAVAVISVATMAGTGLFVSENDRAVDVPALHGFWGHVLVGNSNFELSDDTRHAIAALPGVRSASELTYLPQADLGGHTVDLLVLEPSDVARARITVQGRFPIAPRDILLGSKAASALRKGIGDIITISGQNAPTDFTVVGIGPAPVLGDAPFGDTAVISSRALTEDFPGPPAQLILVELDQGRRGTDAAVAQLSQQVPDIVADIVPGKIDNLHDLRGLLLASAGGTVLLAGLLVINTTVVAARRRAREAAVLKACGATPADLSAIARWQGLATGFTVGVAGTLVGAVAGTRIWQATAKTLGVPSAVAAPPWWIVLAVLLPVAFHVGLSAAAWWRVRSTLAARALRAE